VDQLTVISVDDHLIEPRDLWQKRLPKRLVDRGPRVVKQEYGDAWAFEDRVDPWIATSCSIGIDATDLERFGSYDDLHPGCYDAAARLTDLDAAGVVASLCFPHVSGFSGTMFSRAQDKELGLLCIRAYNDFVIEEWCGAAPGRYIPVVLLPLWDVNLAIEELHRTVAAGARTIAFSEAPERQGFPAITSPDRYWDPLFAAVQEANIPVCLHIGSSSAMPLHTPGVTPDLLRLSSFFLNSCFCLMDWMLSDNFERFPGLKIALSEAGIGWMPAIIERCDRSWEKYRYYTKSGLSNPPSTYFKDHVYGCFMEDWFGMKNAAEIGIDNIMVEVDYPHVDGSFPHTQKILSGHLSQLNDEDRYKVARGNAERLFGFTPSGIGQS
jgi:predicted TIM-barrel fold metal-dependent hydrolase